MTFPIDRRNERSYDAGWSGEVFICDVDRTYLATRFSTMKGLASIPFEFAVDKQDIDGMVSLLKEVRRGPRCESRTTPLYFISASPAQLRSVIERKMLFDGLEFDGTTFKDWLKIISGLRLRRLKEQLGFKLTALLAGRLDLPPGAGEILLGDDLETDPLAFSLYADLLAGRVTGEEARLVLVRHGVAPDDAESIRELLVHAGCDGGVRHICIRMERHSAPEAFLDWAPQLCPCRGAIQMAVSLWSLGCISQQGVQRVARDLASRHWTAEILGERIQDCTRRGIVDRERAELLCLGLAEEGLVPARLPLPALDPVWAAARERDPSQPWTPRRHLQG